MVLKVVKLAWRLGSRLLTLACIVAWLVGRLLTDRYGWSQPVSWIPTPLLIVPVWLAALGSFRRVRKARKKQEGEKAPRKRARAPLVLAAIALLMTLHLGLVELRLYRAALPRDEGGLRVVFWNQAGWKIRDIADRFMPLEPDLFVLANRNTNTTTRSIAQAFIDSGDAYAAVGWPFDLFSRVRITRWASTQLGIDGRSRRADRSLRSDSGSAAWFELETDSGPLIVWAIDLPSDVFAWRPEITRAAGQSIATWRGSVRVMEAEARWHSEPYEGAGFPQPDVVVGDFNIPRGSYSIGELFEAAGASGMRDAFAEAGLGWSRTWPRESPVWAIDHCFVGERVSVRRHRAADPGAGGHRAVVVDVVAE